jgi:hypothetical protein
VRGLVSVWAWHRGADPVAWTARKVQAKALPFAVEGLLVELEALSGCCVADVRVHECRVDLRPST